MQIIIHLLHALRGHRAVEGRRARLANLVSLMLSFPAGPIIGATRCLAIGFFAPVAAALTLGLFVRPHPAKAA